VRWAGGAGTGAGIDDGGALLVRRPDGTLAALAAGEVHLEG
jgi:BirA family biotin operon repressor/biotin-[acetyl-CoA-carboxylase] ligase